MLCRMTETEKHWQTEINQKKNAPILTSPLPRRHIRQKHRLDHAGSAANGLEVMTMMKLRKV